MLQNIPNEKILEIVRLGPTLPAKVAKQIGGGVDTMLIGAMLSSLIGSGEVFISTLKVGSSPLYYVPEHESKLEEFISYLNEKDRRAFNLLKDNKLLQDSLLDPLTRVSMRTIKDFAKPLEIDFKGQKVLFWRYYLVSKDEATILAKNIFKDALSAKSSVDESPKTESPVHAQTVPQTIPRAQPIDIIDESSKAIEPRFILEQPGAIRADEDSLKTSDDTKHAAHKHKDSKSHSELPIHSESHAHSIDHQHKTAEHHKAAHKEELVLSKVVSEDKIENKMDTKDNENSGRESIQNKTVPASKPLKVEYDFYGLILEHISKKNLDLISKEKIKKTEYNLILKNHSNNEYIYCKAKDKSSINEGDLAPALIFAQNKKMPCLFLSTGILAKKTDAMMGKEFSAMTFEKIEILPSHI